MVCKEVVKGLQGFSKGLRRVSEALRFGRLNVIVMCVGVLVLVNIMPNRALHNMITRRPVTWLAATQNLIVEKVAESTCMLEA